MKRNNRKLFAKSEVVGMILTEYDEKKVMENLKKENYLII